MDDDPELDLTLSSGRQQVHVQITALDPALGTWAVAEPRVSRRVVLSTAEALD